MKSKLSTLLKYKVLVTGCAGFIGSNLVDKLILKNRDIIGVDNFDDYYSRSQKQANIRNALRSDKFKFYESDILDQRSIENIFQTESPTHVVHLAARPGVRISLNGPLLYAKNNILGTVNLLKASANNKIDKFIFGSSSSIYGTKSTIPFNEEGLESYSLTSPYAASKRSGEFYVESFAKDHKIKTIIFRFFTVYGKRGRPDMAPALFARAIMDGLEIKQFGSGESSRDYSYIDDVVKAITLGLEKKVGFEIINLGGNKPIRLKDFISLIEKVSGRKAFVKKLPDQAGDVENTWANVEKAKEILGWQPKTDITQGLSVYLEWLKKNT